jgi:hypothetical protein
MSTTADGVETEAQLYLVRQQGCTEVQGLLISPPLRGSAISRLFAETSGMDEWTQTVEGGGLKHFLFGESGDPQTLQIAFQQAGLDEAQRITDR